MNVASNEDFSHLPGDDVVRVFGALANPHRMRILAVLVRGGGRIHVSLLAREVQLSRPLVHMHLQRLEAAGLVSGHLELSPEGKAMKFFQVTPFVLHLTPDMVAEAALTLTDADAGSASPPQKEER
jgi:DNA-binding transcriptional ArsR family regulator